VQAINNTNGGVNSRCRPEKKKLDPFFTIQIKATLSRSLYIW